MSRILGGMGWASGEFELRLSVGGNAPAISVFIIPASRNTAEKLVKPRYPADDEAPLSRLSDCLLLRDKLTADEDDEGAWAGWRRLPGRGFSTST
jgi:hypothetical protein